MLTTQPVHLAEKSSVLISQDHTLNAGSKKHNAGEICSLSQGRPVRERQRPLRQAPGWAHAGQRPQTQAGPGHRPCALPPGPKPCIQWLGPHAPAPLLCSGPHCPASRCGCTEQGLRVVRNHPHLESHPRWVHGGGGRRLSKGWEAALRPCQCWDKGYK